MAGALLPWRRPSSPPAARRGEAEADSSNIAQGGKVFSSNAQNIAQLMAEPPVLVDDKGNTLTFIQSDIVPPTADMPTGGVRYRYQLPSQNGTPGPIFEFIFKNPPANRFSFGFRVSTSVR